MFLYISVVVFLCYTTSTETWIWMSLLVFIRKMFACSLKDSTMTCLGSFLLLSNIIIFIMSCRLTLSHHFFLSFIASGRSSGLHPVSSHSCWMYVWAVHPAFARPYVGVHRSTSLMSSSLLLQQWPACLVRLTCIVFVIGGKWPYSWCVMFWPFDPAKNAIQGGTPEGSDTSRWLEIGRGCVGVEACLYYCVGVWR